jgi:hypothetical protein
MGRDARSRPSMMISSASPFFITTRSRSPGSALGGWPSIGSSVTPNPPMLMSRIFTDNSAAWFGLSFTRTYSGIRHTLAVSSQSSGTRTR